MCIATNLNGHIASTAPPSGFRRLALPIATGFIANSVLFWACHSYLSRYSSWNFRAAKEFCPTDNSSYLDDGGCTRNDLFAFQFVSGIMLAYLGLTGFWSWSWTGRPKKRLPKTPEGRFFGLTLPEADHINAAIVVFQGWDFIVSLFIEEHRTAIMLTHHVMAFLAGAFCLHYQLNPYYAVYYGGTCEFSSIFLVFVDLFKYFPPPEESFLSKFEFICQISFVLTFFWYRVVGWIRVLIMELLPDLNHILKEGLIEKLRPGTSIRWFAYYLGSIGILLGALQLFWFSQIMSIAMGTL